MIGFPLRLLAREVYDRVVKIKGEAQVALVTGEERIAPPGARWFLCTAESMPMEVELRVGAVPGVGDAEVVLVWDPPWDPGKMTDEARLELGML